MSGPHEKYVNLPAYIKNGGIIKNDTVIF